MKGCYTVYLHRNKTTNKILVGRTCQDLEKCWGVEGCNYANNVYFYQDILKYGWDNFEHKILDENLSNYDSKVKENYYIKKYDSILNGYNRTLNNLANKNEKGPGRPKKDRSDKIIIGFESTTPLKIRLEEEAEKHDKSLSALIREILEKHFEDR